MVEQSKMQKRQVACKLMISDILKGRYVKDDQNPGYLILEDNRQISRINIIGVVIDNQNNHSSNYRNITIDDGSGNINLKIFENNSQDEFKVGEPILVIGRIREFANEIYITPEIIKRVDNKDWIELRLLELNQKPQESKKHVEVYDLEEELHEDKGIFSVIRRLDKGDGADITEVIKESKDENAEKIIKNLIKIGELFEIRPGKIKILE
jgi:RPA family protein